MRDEGLAYSFAYSPEQYDALLQAGETLREFREREAIEDESTVIVRLGTSPFGDETLTADAESAFP